MKKRIQIFDKIAEDKLKQVQQQTNSKRKQLKSEIQSVRNKYDKELLNIEEDITDKLDEQDLDKNLDEAFR